MAIPNGAGGYQYSDGNIGEPLLLAQGAPTSIAAAATMTAAQMANGLFVFDGSAGNLTLPTVEDLEEVVSSASKANVAFDFFVVNIDSGSDDVTVFTNTGWTLVGAMQVDNATSGHFRARKTGDGTWTCYRLA
jgi:hypothetical protein